MDAKEKAMELALKFCLSTDVIKPNSRSKNSAIKCCEEIIKLDVLTDEAWLNVPDEYKVQYWKLVIMNLRMM